MWRISHLVGITELGDRSLEVATLCVTQQLVVACAHHVEGVARAEGQTVGVREAATLGCDAEHLTRVGVEGDDSVEQRAGHEEVGVGSEEDVLGAAVFGKLCEHTLRKSIGVVLEDLVVRTGHVDVVVGTDRDTLQREASVKIRSSGTSPQSINNTGAGGAPEVRVLWR